MIVMPPKSPAGPALLVPHATELTQGDTNTAVSPPAGNSSLSTHLAGELQCGAPVINAGGALKHLHDGAVAIHLQDLAAARAAVAQPDVDDLGILGFLKAGRRLGGAGAAQRIAGLKARWGFSSSP